ncbi:hypothetical protein J437_LFUL003273 [Ladona fulva]|uniref:DUF1279 domain-containing protein n=1 Tax=Ladona fulva TaxID=123851 RepID=A0A8K0K0M0_LADFU|nr:hypothetical protein J437_LFUL003273 [Ladona fulva]
MMSKHLLRILGDGKRILLASNSFCYSTVNRDNGHDGTPHLPNNVEEIDAGQKALFSPERSRDITGPNIDSHFQGPNVIPGAQGQQQTGEDAHIGAYDSSGFIHLNSVMQPNVPLTFESTTVGQGTSSNVGVGDHSNYVDVPPEGGHWTGGDKYLAEDRKNVHARGGIQGGERGSKPGTMPLIGINTPKSIMAVLGSLSLTQSYKQNIRWQSGNLLSFHQAYAIWPLKSISCYTYCTSANNSKLVDAPLSRKDKLKKAVKDYGATVIVFHVGISLLSLGGFYLAVSSGLDVVAIMQKIGLGDKAIAKEASTFALAYIVHKAFAPVRISITLTSTPFIVHYLRRVGFLKSHKKT